MAVMSEVVGAKLCEALGIRDVEVEKLTIVMEAGKPARVTLVTGPDRAILERFAEEIARLGVSVDASDITDLEDIGRQFLLVRKDDVGFDEGGE